MHVGMGTRGSWDLETRKDAGCPLRYRQHSGTDNTQVQITLRYKQHSGTNNTQVQTTLRYRQHSGTDNSQVQTTLKYT